MISRTEAERIAAATHTLRPDWPVPTFVTLIVRDLTDWAYRDLATALAYVATDQNIDGSWRSATPARVKEQGPWLNADADTIAARKRALDEARERHEQVKARAQAIAHCQLCDEDGRLDSGRLCLHDHAANNPPIRDLVAQARAAIRPCKAPDLRPTEEKP